jgi:hypothetical protein
MEECWGYQGERMNNSEEGLTRAKAFDEFWNIYQESSW